MDGCAKKMEIWGIAPEADTCVRFRQGLVKREVQRTEISVAGLSAV